jgi:oxygen-independent coproporphyrinogen-3 oxidase
MKPSGLYIHIPFCSGKCLYCAFYSVEYRTDSAGRFVACVARELDLRLAAYPGFEPETIYLGGGTPALLSEHELEVLCAVVLSRISVEKVKEWTIEANPGTLTGEKLQILKKAGVNRVSLGAQSFDDGTLSLLGRRHTCRDTYVAVEQVRKSGIDNLGLDLIACVPGVGREVWQRTLREAIGLEPQHVSVYALTIEEGSRLCDIAAKGQLCTEDDDSQLDSLHCAEAALSDAGHTRYEISNYALPGYECLHNLSCWRGHRYLGVGPSASSYAGSHRWTNAADLETYLSALESGDEPPREMESLSSLTIGQEMLVFGLRTGEGVDLDDVVRRSCVDGERQKKWVELLNGLSESGLVANRGTRWTLTSRGRDLADYVAAELLA